MTDRSPEIDEPTGVETTGHEWDGIKELNNPLPRWWLFIFYACIAAAIVYWVLMPAWPGLPGATGATPGILAQSDRATVASEVAAMKSDRARKSLGLATSSADQILKNPQQLQFAMALGESAFGDNCVPCHGAGGRGAVGYPRLADDVWLWGGSLDDIEYTITHGVRSGAKGARTNDMPAFGRDKFLAEAEINDLTELVVSFSYRPAELSAVERARPLFEKNCSSCHGKAGMGDQTKGAPNLTDTDWIYGGDRPAIHRTIYGPRGGVMPTWGQRLDPATIRALAIYVHSLGGGE